MIFVYIFTEKCGGKFIGGMILIILKLKRKEALLLMLIAGNTITGMHLKLYEKEYIVLLQIENKVIEKNDFIIIDVLIKKKLQLIFVKM